MREVDDEDWLNREGDEEEQFVVWCDVPITRRKRYHLITNADREVVFRSMLFADCLQYLEDEDIARYRFATEDKTFGMERRWCRSKWR